MTGIGQALRPARWRQFAQVVRSRGVAEAVLRARAHLSGGAQAAASGVRRFERSALWTHLAEGGAFHAPAAPALRRGRRKVAVVGDLNLPQCRKYRVEQMAEFWAMSGVAFDRAHYEDVPRALDVMQDATHLVLYRLARGDLASMYLYEARRLGLPVVYDIDDPLFSVPALAAHGSLAALGSARRAHHLDEAPLFLDVLSAADAVTVSTPGLAEEAARFTSRPVWLRRNFADRATLAAGRAAQVAALRRGDLTLALASGSEGRVADLEPVFDGLAGFLLGGRDRRLLLLGRWEDLKLPRALAARVERRPFAGYDSYLTALAGADVALVPLADDAFNRSKSAVRAIDAAAVGLPAVVSDVGDAAGTLCHGETGYGIAPDADWRPVLEALAEPGAAADMGARARKHLEAEWTCRAEPPVADRAFVDWVMA